MAVIAGAGTSEAHWQSWVDLAVLPVLDVADCPRAVVVAAHPDDEILGAGGLIALLLSRGVDVHVVTATAGEASHPGSQVVSPADLIRIRRAESDAAMDVLRAGLPGRLTGDHLGLPDGGLAGVEARLSSVLCDLLAPGDWCVSTWSGDGHPDHEAAGRAALAACLSRGGPAYGFPIWTWHWAEPGDPRVPWEKAFRLPLTAELRSRKAAAVSCYASQLQPLGPAPADAAVVPPEDLAHFARPAEVYFR